MQKVSSKIKQLLKEKNLTTQELAYRLQVSDQAVKKQLSRDNWTVSTLDRYAEVLNVDITEFFTKSAKIVVGCLVYNGTTYYIHNSKDLLKLSEFIQQDINR